MDLDFADKFRTAIKNIDEKGKEYAHAKALSWHLQELRKTVLAQIMEKIPGTSYQDRESKARGSEEYKKHIEGTAAAIEREYLLSAELEKWKATYDAIRSLCSLEKELAKTGSKEQ